MKKYGLVLTLSIAISTYLCAGQYLYICADESSMMTFSESSISGKALFSYENNNGDGFSLNGDEIRFRREFDNIRIIGTIINHSRFSGVRVSLPIIDANSGVVTTKMILTDMAGMPTQNNRYECDVKRVQF